MQFFIQRHDSPGYIGTRVLCVGLKPSDDKLRIDTALLIIALVLASIMLGIALCNFVGH
jgi:hypothetical protein